MIPADRVQTKIWPSWLPLLGALLILNAPNFVVLVVQQETPLKIRILGFCFALGILLVPWILYPARALLWGAVPLAIMAPFEALHIAMMGTPSTVGMIGSLLDTTPREALELGWKIHLMICFALMVPAGQAWLLWKTRGSGDVKIRGRWRWSMAGFAVIAIAAEALHVVRMPVETSWKIVAAKENFERTFPFGLLFKSTAVVKQKAVLATRGHRIRDYKWLPEPASPDTLEETYVIVIGEASRAGNWSLYGYDRPTSPLVQGDTTFLVFEDVTSGANLTFEAVAQLLTLATPQAPERFETTSSIVSAFREAGFRTWWLSLQSRFGISDGKPTMIGLEADESKFLTSDFSDVRESLLDEALLPHLDSALASTSRKKLIILHTLGSHYGYERRYPPGFARFRDSTVQTQSERDHYDNSIAYTDWIVMEVKRRLQASPGLKALAFVSDHGECLGELGMNRHGNKEPARAEFEVPLFFWLSSEIQAQRPKVVSVLRSHRSAAANSSDFPGTWLEIAGIKSPRIDSTRNLGHESYQERQRWAVGSSGTLLDVDRLSGSALGGRRVAERQGAESSPNLAQ